MPTILLSSLFIFTVSIHVLISQAASTRIIPAPQTVLAQEGKFKITSSTRIILGGETTPRDRFAAALINETLREWKDVTLRIISEESVRKISSNFIFIGASSRGAGKHFAHERGIVLRPEMKEEGYALDVRPDGIVILASTSAGQFYGIQSLRQLIDTEKKTLVVPSCSTLDWPRFPFRGISLEFPSSSPSVTEELRNTIRALARLKLNALVLALPLDSAGNPLAVTDGKIQEIEEFARQHCVQVVPQLSVNGSLAARTISTLERFRSSTALIVADEQFASVTITPPTVWERLRRSKKIFVLDTTTARLFSQESRSSSNEFVLLASPGKLKTGKTSIFARANSSVRTIISIAPVSTASLFPNYDQYEVELSRAMEPEFGSSPLGILITNRREEQLNFFPELERLSIAWAADVAWSGRFIAQYEMSKRFFEKEFRSDDAALLALSCYALLGEPSTLVSRDRFFNHPLLVGSMPEERRRVLQIQSTMPLVGAMAQRLKVSATQNLSHAHALSRVAGFISWFARSQTIAGRVRRFASLKPGLDDQSQQGTTLEIRELESDLDSLVNLIPRSHSDAHIEHFRVLQHWWARIRDDVEQGKTPSIPLLPSAWIGDALPDSVGAAERRSAQTVFFRRDFVINDSSVAGWLQVIAHSNVRVWLNGIELEPLAPNSASSTARAYAAVLFSVAPYVRAGSNCFAIEVRATAAENPPLANVFAELKTLPGPSAEMLSDSTWYCSRSAFPQWQTVSTDSLKWKNATVAKVPAVILRPDFHLGRVSWIGSANVD